jgi:hypothetical protein
VLGTQAASAADFYIVRDATTKKCTVVDAKPTTTTTTVVGDGVYKTRVEADSAIKTTKVCIEHSGETDYACIAVMGRPSCHRSWRCGLLVSSSALRKRHA